MISFDFGILFSLAVGIEGLPTSSEGFRIETSDLTQQTLNRFRSTFRNTDGKLFTFASDALGGFEPRIVGDQQLLELTTINTAIKGAFPVYLIDSSLSSELALNFRRQDLQGLQNLPETFKHHYIINFTRNRRKKILDSKNAGSFIHTD